MTEIAAMIEKTAADMYGHRSIERAKAQGARNFAMPWLYATRLHALLDCYAALGGNVSKWRNEANVLR